LSSDAGLPTQLLFQNVNEMGYAGDWIERQRACAKNAMPQLGTLNMSWTYSTCGRYRKFAAPTLDTVLFATGCTA
jgi:hypothetical protein